MQAKVGEVLRRHKFQSFKDVMTSETLGHEVFPHASSMAVDDGPNESIQAAAQISIGRG
jgi:hypothetical protein